MSLAIVGADHPNEPGQPHRRFEIAVCQPGDPVELRREPKNPADPRAIGVWSERGVRLGFITAERAPWLGKLLGEREVEAVFQAATDFGAIIRVGFDGVVPLIPSRARSRSAVTRRPASPQMNYRLTIEATGRRLLQAARRGIAHDVH